MAPCLDSESRPCYKLMIRPIIMLDLVSIRKSSASGVSTWHACQTRLWEAKLREGKMCKEGCISCVGPHKLQPVLVKASRVKSAFEVRSGSLKSPILKVLFSVLYQDAPKETLLLKVAKPTEQLEAFGAYRNGWCRGWAD